MIQEELDLLITIVLKDSKKLNIILLMHQMFLMNLKYYFKDDTHLNIEGNKIFANKIIEKFQEENSYSQ